MTRGVVCRGRFGLEQPLEGELARGGRIQPLGQQTRDGAHGAAHSGGLGDNHHGCLSTLVCRLGCEGLCNL